MGQGISICDRCPDEKACWQCPKLRQWIWEHLAAYPRNDLAERMEDDGK